jgi:hypothetical protein
MTVYWHGDIGLGSGDDLLSKFFAKAPGPLRAEAVQFLGIALAQETSAPAEVLDRLKRLWESRRDATGHQAGRAEELAAFGWWFVSGKFDEPWAVAQLTDILARARKVAPEHQVMQWLADVATRLPREAMRCLELFAEGCNWDFHLTIWNAAVNAILSTALLDSDAEIRLEAANLIDQLGSRGHRMFRSLLQGPTGTQQ